MPAEKARPSWKMRERLSTACCTNDRTLIETTGSTQGMTFRIAPGMNAKTSHIRRLRCSTAPCGLYSGNLTAFHSASVRAEAELSGRLAELASCSRGAPVSEGLGSLAAPEAEPALGEVAALPS